MEIKAEARAIVVASQEQRETSLRPVGQTGFQPVEISVAPVYDRRTGRRPVFHT